MLSIRWMHRFFFLVHYIKSKPYKFWKYHQRDHKYGSSQEKSSKIPIEVRSDNIWKFLFLNKSEWLLPFSFPWTCKEKLKLVDELRETKNFFRKKQKVNWFIKFSVGLRKLSMCMEGKTRTQLDNVKLKPRKFSLYFNKFYIIKFWEIKSYYWVIENRWNRFYEESLKHLRHQFLCNAISPPNSQPLSKKRL